MEIQYVFSLILNKHLISIKYRVFAELVIVLMSLFDKLSFVLLKKRIKKYRKPSNSLSKKTKGSKQYKKARLKTAKFHPKLKDTRNYFLHKLSTEMSVKIKQLF